MFFLIFVQHVQGVGPDVTQERQVQRQKAVGVVDLVGHARHQYAKGGHLVGLDHLLPPEMGLALGFLAGRDVRQLALDEHRAALIVLFDPGVEFHPDFTAVLATHAGLEILEHTVATQDGEDQLPVVGVAVKLAADVGDRGHEILG